MVARERRNKLEHVVARLFIHIGAKKTGTTTIQAALKSSADVLKAQGIYTSAVAGKLEDKAFSRYYKGQLSNAEKVRIWYSEAVEFVRAGDDRSAMISAESLSDLSAREIERFRAEIPSVFDSFVISFFLRRQDLAAVSHYSTALKGGGVSEALISKRFGNRTARGLNYWSVCCDWTGAFGRQAMRPRLYPDVPDRNWDVLEDFLRLHDLGAITGQVMSTRKNVPVSRNVAAYLRRFNLLARAGRVDSSGRARRLYIRSLMEIADGKPIPKPSRSTAVAFYDGFKEENEKVRGEFFSDREHLFSRDFSMYPEEAQRLDDFVDEAMFRSSVAPFLLEPGTTTVHDDASR